MIKAFFSIIGVIFSLALESAGLILFLKDRPGVFNAFVLNLVILHLASSVLLSVSLYRLSVRWRHSSPKNWLIATFFISLAFPLVGPLGTVGVFFLYSVSPIQKSGAYEEYEKYITYDFKPEEKYMPSDRLVEGIEEELQVMPLVEVLAETDPTARQGVVNIIEKLPKKDAVRLLKIALEDKSVEVRYAAAFELSRAEAEFNENIFMAREEAKRNPDSADAYLALGNGYSEYCESGLLDEYAAKYYRDLAMEEYKKALRLGGENVQILNYLAHLELLSKNYDDAAARFRRVTQLDPGNVFANVGLVSICYERHQIKEAIRYANDAMIRMPQTKGPMREIISYWAS